MVKEKVTKEDLLSFGVGDQKTFTLPNYNKARSAASFAHQQKRTDMGRTFKALIGDPMEGTEQRSVTITRLA